MLAWETIFSLHNLPLTCSELFCAFETERRTLPLGHTFSLGTTIICVFSLSSTAAFWSTRVSEECLCLALYCCLLLCLSPLIIEILFIQTSYIGSLDFFFFLVIFCFNPSPLLFLSVLHCLLLQMGFFSLQLLTLFFPVRDFLMCLSRWPSSIWLTQGEPDFLCFDCCCCRAGHFLLTWWDFVFFHALSPGEYIPHPPCWSPWVS